MDLTPQMDDNGNHILDADQALLDHEMPHAGQHPHDSQPSHDSQGPNHNQGLEDNQSSVHGSGSDDALDQLREQQLLDFLCWPSGEDSDELKCTCRNHPAADHVAHAIVQGAPDSQGLNLWVGWEKQCEWTHPQMNLNLLQLAIIFRRTEYIENLWRLDVLVPERYRDEEGRLVNHPFHLMRVLCPEVLSQVTLELSFSDSTNWRDAPKPVADEVFFTEGIVDLTPATLQKPCLETPGVCLHCQQAALEDGALIRPAPEEIDPQEQLDMLALQETTVPPLCDPGYLDQLISEHEEPVEVVEFLFRLLADRLTRVVTHPGTVELVWALGRCLASHKTLDTAFSYVVSHLAAEPRILTEYKPDVLTFVFQLTWSVDETISNFPTENLYRKDLVRRLVSNCVHSGAPIPKAAFRLLPIEYVYFTSHYPLCIRTHNLSNCESREAVIATQTSLKKLQRVRSLKDKSALKMMEMVRGDVGRVWEMSDIPLDVKELFPVPFQGLYERLQARSTGQAPKKPADTV